MRHFPGIRRRATAPGPAAGTPSDAAPSAGAAPVGLSAAGSVGANPVGANAAGAVDGELADIIRYGAGMLDDVEDAVRRCRSDPDPGTDLARTCGTLVSGYLTLRERLGALPATPVSLRVDQLLNYALLVTDQASLLAFRARDEHWQRLADEFGDGLGPPAEELRALARQFR